jgi:hypothetical protein
VTAAVVLKFERPTDEERIELFGNNLKGIN